MGDYRQLKVWEKAHQLCLAVLQTTKSFPREEQYGLVAQLRKSAISIPSNIAEGSGRQSDGDMGRFLQSARGSLWELAYQLRIARDLEYLPQEQWTDMTAQCDEIGRMLHGLQAHLRQHGQKSGSGRRRTGAPEKNGGPARSRPSKTVRKEASD
jgi:four helix bundle protein